MQVLSSPCMTQGPATCTCACVVEQGLSDSAIKSVCVPPCYATHFMNAVLANVREKAAAIRHEFDAACVSVQPLVQHCSYQCLCFSHSAGPMLATMRGDGGDEGQNG